VVAADIEVSRKLLAGSGAGALVRFGDSKELAIVIENLLNGDEIRREMGKLARGLAAFYDGASRWSRNADALETEACAHNPL
jgi:glycosyltransferase involved in cell wall biosynthesis